MQVDTFEYVGTVVCGTLLVEDILPACLEVLQALDKQAYIDTVCDFPAEAAALAKQGTDTFLSEAFDEFLGNVFDALNDLAPEGYYFGSHVGDAADFGFWPSDD